MHHTVFYSIGMNFKAPMYAPGRWNMNRVSQMVKVNTGVQMPYFEQGDRSGIPLLLVHGVGDSGRIFEGLLDHLPEWVHAFAPTLRGHGDASRPASGYQARDFAVDLVAFMDALGIEAAVLAGASSGGLVAQRFAIDHPARIRRLVLLGSPLSLGNKPGMWELWQSTFSKLTDPVPPAFVRGFIEGMLSRPTAGDVLDAAVRESLKVPAFVWKATVKGVLEADFSGELGQVGVPTLIIWGDRDELLAREDQEALEHLISQARLVVFEGAGHMFYWEDPDRTAAHLAAFLHEFAKHHEP
jgi:pimeloyl-ACP methyl ester carboxylesterase